MKDNNYSRRSRIHMIRLYPDNESHCKALEYIQSNYKQYAFCLHDKDTYDSDDSDRGIKEGDIKKAHWHVILKFPEARTRSSVVKDFKGLISELDIIPYSSLRDGLLYLVHAENSDKYQYDKECVQGTLQTEFITYMSKVGMSEYEICCALNDYIVQHKGITLFSFQQYCLEMGYINIYRRYYQIYKDILMEERKLC